MNALKLHIVSVDMYGYNGRDHHPESSDIGSVVTVLKAETFLYTVDGDLIGDALEIITETGPIGPVVEDTLETCFTCVTETGRILELMGHEVVVAS